MIILDKILEKKQKKEYEKELSTNHIILQNISNTETTAAQSTFFASKMYLCLVRSVLIFFCAFGTIGSLTSAFGLKYHYYAVIPVSLFICVYIAFIYYNRITFYIGYALYFIVFSTFIFGLYWYVNSGYQAFMNTVYEEYSDYFNLASVREASEFITDRTLTVSIAMIFVVAFLALLLNITISGYMSMIETFLITFPLIQVALYIDKKPNIIYVIMLVSAYITILILGRSNHFKMPNVGKKNDKYTTIKEKNKDKRYHSYPSNGHALIINTVLSLVVVSIFLFATNNIFYTENNSKAIRNKLKNTTDEYVKNYVQSGIWSIFDRYSSTGGLSGGMLGGVGSVRPDYQTDLEVTFVPETTSFVYLKAYIGTKYSGSGFNTTPEDVYEPEKFAYSPNMYAISDYNPMPGATAKMKIKNIDAGRKYNFMPYYSVDISDEKETDEDYEYIAYYNAFDNLRPFVSDETPSVEYEEFVHNTYLDVPENLNDILFETSYDAGLESISPSKDNQSQVLENADRLKRYFVNNYSYTMAPGATPRSADFVGYFLEKQKRGFCAHFAASSVLLMRYQGIPARYVEGYAITLSHIVDGEPLEGDINEWISSPENIKITDTGLVQVNVTDAQAHAWVEIYIDGYGWIPYEFTPPSDDEELITNFRFSSLISGLFQSSSNNDNDTNNNGDGASKYSFNFMRTFSFIGTPFVIIILVIIGIYMLYKLWTIVSISIKVKQYENSNQYNEALTLLYSSMIKKLSKKNIDTFKWTTRDLKDYIDTCIPNDKIIIDESIYASINQALYSDCQLDQQSYIKCKENISYITKLKQPTKNNKNE